MLGTANCPVTPHVQVEELSFSRRMFHHHPFGAYDVKCLHQMIYARKGGVFAFENSVITVFLDIEIQLYMF